MGKTDDAVASREYTISKAQLIKVYSKLDGNLIAQIQKC
jgi:hypothetical protein